MNTIHLRKRDRDKIAAIFSVLPGAGHLYKHHYIDGLTLLIVGNALMLFVSALLALATFGASLFIVPAVYCAGVAYSAYKIEDWHGKHHYLHPWSKKQ